MRFGLPLMVLTSMSVHVIAILLWLLAGRHSTHPSYSLTRGDDNPALILTKETFPTRLAQPASATTPPPPSARLAVPTALAAKLPPIPRRPATPESVLSPNGARHLDGGVVFVLDISGSMYEAYAGASRLAFARQILDRQIAALPNGTPFAVTLYGETTRRSGPLVAASSATREAARRYVAEDFSLGGGTNLPAGLDAAAELHPGSVVVVTDGDLNIADKRLLAEARRILGPRGPRLSVIAIAPRRKTDAEEILRDLVRQQAGNYQSLAAPEDAEARADETGTPP